MVALLAVSCSNLNCITKPLLILFLIKTELLFQGCEKYVKQQSIHTGVVHGEIMTVVSPAAW